MAKGRSKIRRGKLESKSSKERNGIKKEDILQAIMYLREQSEVQAKALELMERDYRVMSARVADLREYLRRGVGFDEPNIMFDYNSPLAKEETILERRDRELAERKALLEKAKSAHVLHDAITPDGSLAISIPQGLGEELNRLLMHYQMTASEGLLPDEAMVLGARRVELDDDWLAALDQYGDFALPPDHELYSIRMEGDAESGAAAPRAMLNERQATALANTINQAWRLPRRPFRWQFLPGVAKTQDSDPLCVINWEVPKVYWPEFEQFQMVWFAANRGITGKVTHEEEPDTQLIHVRFEVRRSDTIVTGRLLWLFEADFKRRLKEMAEAAAKREEAAYAEQNGSGTGSEGEGLDADAPEAERVDQPSASEG